MSEQPDRDRDAGVDTGGEAPCYAHLLGDGRAAVVVELDRVPDGASGAAWSLPHDGDLDANLVRLGAGESIGAHENREVDVLIIVRRGDGSVRIDDVTWPLAAGALALVPVGSRRSITAWSAGLEYLSIHRRRGGLTIGGASAGR